jgi:hypothetical protein
MTIWPRRQVRPLSLQSVSNAVCKEMFEAILLDFAKSAGTGKSKRIVLQLNSAGWHGRKTWPCQPACGSCFSLRTAPNRVHKCRLDPRSRRLSRGQACSGSDLGSKCARRPVEAVVRLAGLCAGDGSAPHGLSWDRACTSRRLNDPAQTFAGG